MDADDRRLAAAFLAQALDLADDPEVLAPDLVPVDRDDAVAVFAADLDSSVGPAAFLIYRYELGTAAGRAGRERFEADLAVLETAAARNTPGPRIVAHAVTADHAFVLATSPATLRALTGDGGPTLGQAAAAGAGTSDDLERRAITAAELLRLLRLADAEAAAWLLAAPSAPIEPDGDRGGGRPSDRFTPEETELALFLLDDHSIEHLLRALNQMLTLARASPPPANG